MRTPFRVVVSLFVAQLALAAGCQKSAASAPPAVPAGGKVTYKGQPVRNALVTFYQDDGTEVATGTTDENGDFKLSTYGDCDGAPVGDYKVTVSVEETGDGEGSARSPLPPRFAASEQTTLTAKVAESGPNEFLLDLK